MCIPGLTSTSYGEDHERVEREPEVLKLWLPSQLPSEHRTAWCLPGIPYLEFRFRYAQADDVLTNLRRHIKLLQLARDQNTKHIKSTAATTRSQGILDGFRGKIDRLASQYKYARQALLALDPEQKFAPTWKKYFLELTAKDLRAPVRDKGTNGESSEGQFQPAWIWAVPRAPPIPDAATRPLNPSSASLPGPITPANREPDNSLADDMEGQEFDRVQWAKCQARAERYEEEVELTVEEMGRTLRYFEWKRDWWLTLVPGKFNTSGEPIKPSDMSLPVGIEDGLRAYAHRQSQVYNDLITSFVGHWRKYLLSHSLGATWLGNYPPPVDPIPVRPSRGHQKSDAERAPIAKVSAKSATSELPATPHDSDVDEPLEIIGDDDGDTPGGADAGIDAEIDAEEMFSED